MQPIWSETSKTQSWDQDQPGESLDTRRCCRAVATSAVPKSTGRGRGSRSFPAGCKQWPLLKGIAADAAVEALNQGIKAFSHGQCVVAQVASHIDIDVLSPVTPTGSLWFQSTPCPDTIDRIVPSLVDVWNKLQGILSGLPGYFSETSF